MARIFRDGFDTYNGIGNTVGLAAKYTTGSGASLVTGRFGGQALRLASSNSASYIYNISPFTAASSFTFTAGYRSAAGSASPCLGFLNVTTNHITMIQNTDGSLTFTRAGTSLGSTAAGVITFNIWYSLQIEIVISDTVGRITCYVDGAQVLNLTSQDTRNGATTTVDTVRLGNQSAVTIGQTDYDDAYITDSATKDSNIDRCETLYCNADGSTLNWTPSTGATHFGVVDEATASSTDYLSASTVGDVDELDLTALSTTPVAITEVVVVGYMNKTDANVREVYLGVKSGATTDDGTSHALNSTGFRHETPRATDPNTAAAWTTSAVNALQVRPKVSV